MTRSDVAKALKSLGQSTLLSQDTLEQSTAAEIENHLAMTRGVVRLVEDILPHLQTYSTTVASALAVAKKTEEAHV